VNPLRVVRSGLVPYSIAYEWQRQLHQRRLEGRVPDVLLLLQHPHVYTLGRRFSPEHLLTEKKVLEDKGIEIVEADRGGSITYHGPGQLVGYPILDLRRRSRSRDPQPDVIIYLRRLEEAIIRAARSFNVAAGRKEGMTGVWVGDTKLAAIGVNVSRGISKHGFAINVSTDLDYYSGMIPCGIPSAEPTSLEHLLRRPISIDSVADAVITQLAKVLHRVPIESTFSELGLGDPKTSPQATPEKEADVIQLPRRQLRPPLSGAAGD
jgi:lipoyl(octanoyl) transferase